MKVALLAYDYTRLSFLFGIRDLLLANRCEVKCFTHHGDPKGEVPHEAHPWGDFRFEKLQDFGPEKIIMFNGFAEATLPATQLIKSKFDTYHVEQGWLPQKGNIYIDNRSTGWRSNVTAHVQRVNKSFIEPFEMGKTVGELRSLYRDCGSYRAEAGKKYVVIPTQLEHDTSIIYDSPYFKTMDSMIGFVRRALKGKDIEVIVKTHPRDKDKSLRAADGLKVVRDGSLVDMIAQKECVGVIGINSTSLIEALIHEKPVICLGLNVACGLGAFQLEPEMGTKAEHDLNRLFHQIPEALKRPVSLEQIYRALYGLQRLQFKRSDPPEWVYNFLKNGALPE